MFIHHVALDLFESPVTARADAIPDTPPELGVLSELRTKTALHGFTVSFNLLATLALPVGIFLCYVQLLAEFVGLRFNIGH